MAQLRLIAVIAAFGACRASEAGPTSGLTAPAGWRPLPELATAATDAAKQAKITVTGAEAWGDPARGCYAAWLAVSSAAGDPVVLGPKLVEQLRTDLGGELRDVVLPAAASSALSLRFVRAPYEGTLRADIAKTGGITVLACFWNAREPKACEAACGGIK